MILNVVEDYYNIIRNIPRFIDISGFRNDFLAKKIGLKPQTFSAKKTSGSWSEEELSKLFRILSTDEVEDYYLGMIMEKTEGEPEDLISLSEFRKMKEWK